MNSRYYEPTTGRFITQDTYKGNPYDPWTQHLYSYCGNNPTNFVDPTGNMVEATAGGGCGVFFYKFWYMGVINDNEDERKVVTITDQKETRKFFNNYGEEEKEEKEETPPDSSYYETSPCPVDESGTHELESIDWMVDVYDSNTGNRYFSDLTMYLCECNRGIIMNPTDFTYSVPPRPIEGADFIWIEDVTRFGGGGSIDCGGNSGGVNIMSVYVDIDKINTVGPNTFDGYTFNFDNLYTPNSASRSLEELEEFMNYDYSPPW